MELTNGQEELLRSIADSLRKVALLSEVVRHCVLAVCEEVANDKKRSAESVDFARSVLAELGGA